MGLRPLQRFVLWLLLLGAVVAPPLSARSSDDLTVVQEQIEREIKALLSEQLAAGEFLAFAIVTAAESAENTTSEAADNQLPYTSLKVSKTVLQEILERNIPKNKWEGLTIEVTVGLDERLPEEKRKLLEDVIRKRFGFDGQKKILKVEAMKLVTSRLADSEKFALEKLKMESDQARLALENEKTKLEVKQKDLEITALKAAKSQEQTPQVAPQQIITTPPPAAAAVPAPQQPATAPAAPTQVLAPQLALFKDFQLTAMALVIGIVLIVAIMVGGSFFVRGVSPLSTAIEAVGSSIETAAKSVGGGQTQVTAITQDNGGGGGVGGGGAVENQVINATTTNLSEAEQRANEEFLKTVQDKIEVLCKEKNYNFYRIFSDMIDGKTSLPYAASILISIDHQTARQVVNEISIEDIAKIRAFLGSEGGLIKAKEMRSQALTDFYGRIAMEEFLNSPLMAIKDLQWLTKMTTADMAKFIVSLSETERPVFLACLSPERVKKLIGAVKDDDKDVLIKALGLIDTVTEDKIRPVVEQLSKKMSSVSQSKTVGPKSAVDSAKYIAAIASDLSEAEQAKLFGAINEKAELVEGIKEHFVPFATLTTLPKELVMEIFGDKQDAQIAQIIFDSAEEVRRCVIGCLPDIRAESVKDELKSLDDNKFYEKRNRRQSLKMQKEISRYLQKLNAEGLLNLQGSESKPAQALNTNESAA